MRFMTSLLLTSIFCFSFAIAAETRNYYFAESGEYTMATEAYQDALPPPDALRVAPAFAEGYWPVVTESRDGWIMLEDHRGEEGWVDGERVAITVLGPLPEGWMATPPEVIVPEEEIAAQKANSLLYSASLKTQAETFEFTDAELAIIGKAGHFDDWVTGEEYKAGKRLFHKGVVYVVIQDVPESLEHQPPDASGMLAIYRPVVQAHAGTLGDPIPFIYGMDTETGKYYIYESSLYLCKSRMLACVWYPGTAGLWQWEAVKQ